MNFFTRQAAQEEGNPPAIERPLASYTNVTLDSIYQFYLNHLLPAFVSSIPMLFQRLWNDLFAGIASGSKQFVDFVSPKWHTITEDAEQVWLQLSKNSSEVLLQFDTNGDGHISPAELLNMTEALFASMHTKSLTWWQWFSREWPLMDWKVGIFLWKTFGGVLLLLACCSIVPGRLHSISAKILRWPVLGITYFLIVVELFVYIIIRIGIRVAEHLVARPKHRRLRQQMADAKSYDEWYEYASALDKSQRRDKWLKHTHDHTSYEYNWAFIRELMQDMRNARKQGDALLALAVIQQCTRKNVGGVMSEDLFSYSNTGEPKVIVKEFIEEVVTTLHWITEDAMRHGSDVDDTESSREYHKQLSESVRGEKDKLWKSLVDITSSFLESGSSSKNGGSSDGGSNGLSPASSVSDHKEYIGDEMASSPETPKRPLPSVHREQVLTFLKRARAAYGRTALCLSGGAMMGLYHFGVVKALLEAKMLPHIISGTSAGSVVGAILCTRTDDELMEILKPEILVKKLICFQRPWKERIKGVWKNGNLFEFEEWMELIKWFTRGDMTFLESYRRTGKVLCITLSSTSKRSPPVLLNYLSAPDVTIASAVIASAAVPGFIDPVRLQIKDANGVVRFQGGEKDESFWDGSIRQDLPTKGLSEMLNCQFFIASQCNPHIVPFFFNPKGGVGAPSRWSSGQQEDSWRGGFLLAALQMYLKNDMQSKFVFLNEVEAAVGFTSTLLTQDFMGSTTIVPHVRFSDYFKLFSNPNLVDLRRYFEAGAVSAYGHLSMISLHYSIADALDDCISKLESGKRKSNLRRFSQTRRKSGGVERKSITGMVDDLVREKKIHKQALALQESSETEEEDEDEYERF